MNDAVVTITTSPESALLIDGCLDQIAAGVCDDDSRTRAERRAGAAECGLTGKAFTCDCSAPDCPARASAA